MANKKISDLDLSSGLNDTDVYEVSTTATTSEKTTWSLIKSTLKTYFDSLTTTLTNKTINTASNTITVVEADISDLGSYTTASSTDTLTNKTINTASNTITIVEADISDLDHTDADAIHDNVSGEITALTAKATGVANDRFIIEDSAAGDVKKRLLMQGIRITESQITDLGSYITASSSETLTNKTIDFDDNTINDMPCEIQIACSDLTTALTTGTSKGYFRMPYAMTLTEVRASLLTAGGTSGTTTIDINDGGTTVLSTKLTIDNTEKTSETAATPPVISDSALADDAEITIDIDAVTGDADEAGLIVTLIGKR